MLTAPPDRFTDRQIEAFARMAAANGAQREGLALRVRAAATLCFVTEGGALKGIAGIKSPHGPYHARVFGSAGVAELRSRYPLEFGWMYLAPELRGQGHGKAMLRACMATADGYNLFATSRTDNVVFARLAEAQGFARLGRPYVSRLGGYGLSLFGCESR